MKQSGVFALKTFPQNRRLKKKKRRLSGKEASLQDYKNHNKVNVSEKGSKTNLKMRCRRDVVKFRYTARNILGANPPPFLWTTAVSSN